MPLDPPAHWPRTAPAELATPRLLLRQWRDADRAPFADLNADPEVMAHFPSTLPAAESDALVERIAAGLDEWGWGLWAVEVTDTGEFAGFVGLNRTLFEAPFTPAVEIGWRLARAHWGHGLATEGARAALDHAFGVVGLDEIVSFTVPGNRRSQRVMQKLGMHRDPAGDFVHPNVAAGDPLRRHVLYRLARTEVAVRS